MSRHIPDDEFDRRLRDVLHSRALSITPDVDAIDRIHAGAQRRQRRQRVAVSGSAALAVIAVASVGIAMRPTHHNGSQLAGGPSSTSPSIISSTASGAPSPVPSTVAPSSNTFTATGPAATTPATIPAGGAPPAGFVPMSVTAVNANTFWVLGHAPCAQGSSCVGIAKTTDGGKTFTEVGAPAGNLVPDTLGHSDVYGSDTISDIRFVDGKDGWAYGGGLWQTTDGGQHWTAYGDAVATIGTVQQVAVASGHVWAVAFTGTAGAAPSYQLYTATYPNGRWTTAMKTVFGPAEPMLAVQGKTVTIIGTDFSTGKQAAFVTTDSATFTPVLPLVPCTSAPGAPLSPTPQGLWLVCTSSTTKSGGVAFSPDFGGAWRQVSSTIGAHDQRVAIGGVDDKSAIVATGGKLVRVNVDGSTASVSTPNVPSSTEFAFVGFTTASDGFAIPVVNGTRQLWRTTDAGAHWSVVKF